MAIVAAMFGSTASAQLALPTLATTDKGIVIGKLVGQTRQFLGVPYAAPPVGNLRWKAPAPERLYGLRDATRFANHCAQPASPFGVASQSEDCLYLNVFAPPALSVVLRPAPVMVWFHPGAFLYGESDDYNPTELVKRGVIVVTVNYRLGALGFTAHPALTAETNGQTSGNYGFQDQQAALRWVQRNIRNFGGDPDNVTIFGESAGGVSVYTHLASPASAGLFHRAIAQSGTYAFAAPQTTRAAAEVNGQAFATALGCAAGDLACMRAAPVSTVLSKQSTSPIAYLPNIDGSLLPQATLVLLGTGQFNRVPVLQGTTHDEYRLFVATLFELQGNPVTTANYPLAIQAALGVNAATADALANIFYTVDEYETASLALGELGTDAIFACPSRQLARSMIAYVPMYLYEFSDQNAPQDVLPPVSFPYGAYHGAEVQYLLDSQDGAAAFTSAQTSLANHMKNYWTQFAKTGNPNGGTSPAWAVFVHRADNNFQQLIAPTPAPSSDDSWLLDHGCNFWNGF